MKRLIPFLFLIGCAGKPEARPEPVIVVQEVKVPVSVPCIPTAYSAVRPDYVDGDIRLRAAADAAERYQLLWAGRAQRIAREKENETVIAGCPRGSSK